MYSYDKDLAALVAKVINEDEAYEALKGCRLAVLYFDREKKRNGRQTFADTRKLSELASFLANVDFVITFYQGVEYLSETALEILVKHNLMHVGYESRGGEVKKKIVPHDVEDFRDIIAEHGVDWPLMGDK